MPQTSTQEINVILHGLKHEKRLETDDNLHESALSSIEYQYLVNSVLEQMAMGDMRLNEALLMMFGFGVDFGFLLQNPDMIPKCPQGGSEEDDQSRTA